MHARNEALALAQQKEQYYRLQLQDMLVTAYNETVNGAPVSNMDTSESHALSKSIAIVSENILKGREVVATGKYFVLECRYSDTAVDGMHVCERFDVA